MSNLAPPVLILDEFLKDKALRAELLQFTLDNSAQFERSTVHTDGETEVREDYRISLYCKSGLGPLDKRLRQIATDNFAQLCAGAGITPFPIGHIETELAAHGDGAFFNPHIDTFSGRGRSMNNSDRVLTAVYYFHREPKGFSGGSIEVFPYGYRGGPTQIIEPVQNRLICFASTALHRVNAVSCPSGAFADYRFAINFWYHRPQEQRPQ
jgi:SM-20-related protein